VKFDTLPSGLLVPRGHANISRLDELWDERWAPFDNREIWEWIEQEIEDLPSCYAVRGRFDASLVPFTKDVFRALRSPTIRRVIARAGVQSLKTLIGEFWLLWLIDNNPGPTQWLQTTNEDAKEHAETRFNLLIDACPKIAKYYTGNSEDDKTVSINFVHMFLLMQGAFTKRNLQRKSIKNQMCSEIWQSKYWPPGRLDEAS
jgi:phage terminase large subunit GpA-like protein